MTARRFLEVLDTGPLALVQDAGRPGLAAIGVGRSGAADRAAYALANRLVANPAGTAAIEATLGGLVVRARADLVLAVTGALLPVLVEGRPVGHAAPFAVAMGERVELGRADAGLRGYLAVRGGIDVPPVLGSRSTDTLSRIGPDPLEAGDLLPVGPAAADLPHLDQAPVAPPPGGRVDLRVLPGPRADWLAHPDAVAGQEWAVSSRSDRVGVRLDGPPLSWARDRVGTELPSEGVVRGAVQVPPGGRPVVFLADHPVTGGYPVVAVVADEDTDRLAQLVPGQPVRLRPAAP